MPAQLAVTLASLPLAVFVGWIGTRLVERPITTYGRSWSWSAQRRATPSIVGSLHGVKGLPSPA